MKDISTNQTCCHTCFEILKLDGHYIVEYNDMKKSFRLFTQYKPKYTPNEIGYKFTGGYILHATKCDINKCRKEQ